MDDVGNGSLPLIKAACLARFAHHNLRMDYAAVCGSQYRYMAVKRGAHTAAALAEAAAEQAKASTKHVTRSLMEAH